jgi:opacity protein-like surface antigen
MKPLLVAAALCFSVPLPALAQPISEPSGPDTYLALHLGAFIPKGDLEKLNFDPGLTLSGAFGARFNPHFSAELELGWDNAASKAGGMTLTFTDVPVAINLVGRLPFKEAEFTLYGGAAVHFTGLETPSGSHQNDTAFGYHFGVGAAFNLSRTMAVGLDGRWSFVTANYGYGNVSIDGIRVAATLQYRF